MHLISQHIADLISLADEQRVQRALEGLQNKDLVVQPLGTEMGILTASVHSKNNKSYGVAIGPKSVACACPDHYYRGANGNGQGYICKHIISVVFHMQELLSKLANNHTTHKVI